MKNKQNLISYLLLLGGALVLGVFFINSEQAQPKNALKVKQVQSFDEYDDYDEDDELQTVTKHLKDGHPMKKYVPEGVQIIQEERMQPGLTLVPMFLEDRIQLINHQGEVINSWNVRTKRTRLLKNCNIIVVHKRKKEEDAGGRMRNTLHVVSEYDWDGNLVREFRVNGEVHHDTRMLSNDRVMILNREFYRKGDPEINYPNVIDPYPGYTLKFDVVSVLDYKTGKSLFRWDFLDSYKADKCGGFGCPLTSVRFVREDKEHVDWTHVNSVTEIPENQWYKSGHEHFKPGNLLLTVRNWSAILILDIQTGKIVWEYNGEKQGLFEGGHDAYMIEPGLSGAGNILIFDNGDPRLNWDRRPYKSRVLEINPVSLETVWSFDDDGKLFTQSLGSMQRLANGNTLVSQDGAWRVIEVTPAKEIIWQYNAGGATSRAYRYPHGYCERFPEQKS